MEFLILGPLEVRNGEHTVRLGAAKQRALLGVLLLHANETVSTSRLVDELWGERPPATAEKLVQGYVHALRKELGNDVLQTQPPGYRLSVEPRALDLARVRAADRGSACRLRRRLGSSFAVGRSRSGAAHRSRTSSSRGPSVTTSGA